MRALHNAGGGEALEGHTLCDAIFSGLAVALREAEERSTASLASGLLSSSNGDDTRGADAESADAAPQPMGDTGGSELS